MVGVTFRSAKLDHCGLRIKLPLKGVKFSWSGQCDKLWQGETDVGTQDLWLYSELSFLLGLSLACFRLNKTELKLRQRTLFALYSRECQTKQSMTWGPFCAVQDLTESLSDLGVKNN